MKSSSRRSEDDCARAYSSRYLWEFLGGICERGQKIFGEDFYWLLILFWFDLWFCFFWERGQLFILKLLVTLVFESHLFFLLVLVFQRFFLTFWIIVVRWSLGYVTNLLLPEKKTSPTIRDSFCLGLGFKVTWISSPLIPKKVGKAKRVSWKTVWEVNIAPEN